MEKDKCCRKNRVTAHYSFIHWPIFCFTHTLLPWLCSGSKTSTDIHTPFNLFEEKRQVCDGRRDEAWKERENTVHTQYLYKTTAMRCWQPFWASTKLRSSTHTYRQNVSNIKMREN